MDVSYINGVGTATYQWYENTVNNNSGGILFQEQQYVSYTPPVFNTIGFILLLLRDYFMVMVVMMFSNAAEIIVVDDPTVSAPSPSYQQLCQNAPIQDISIVASNGVGSTYTYQWYENIHNNSGGTPIPGATSISYTPQNTTVGITYYYCVVTQPASGCESVSVTAEVDIVPGPTFTTQPQDDQACVGVVISALSRF